MADPTAVIVRFPGDPDDLLERFETARRRWIEAQDHDPQPVFYAACKTGDGIVVINAWETQAAHHAFGHGLAPHLEAAGIARPENVERLAIDKLGWH